MLRLIKKRGRRRFVRKLFVKMPERGNDAEVSDGQVMEGGKRGLSSWVC